MMPAWLDPALAYVPQWLDLQAAKHGLPGLSVAVAHRGAPVMAHAVGLASVRGGETLTAQHRFRVASHSKTFTAAAVMKLAEAGRIRLDDRVGTHVKGLHKTVAAATIAQLLSHTGGVTRDGEDIGQWSDRRPFLNEAELRAGLADPTVIPPNTRFKYSNHAFGLVGLAIAAVTGESYNDWVAREIVAASGLEETTPDTPLPKRTPFASGHVSRLLMGEAFTIPSDNCTNALAAATGFVSTPTDLARFYSSLDPAARKSVISVESRREMTRRHWSVADMSTDRGYGLGTIHGTAGAWSWFGHSGGFQGSLSNTCVVPGQDIAVSAAINSSESDPAAVVDGVLRILQVFAKHGAPSKKTADWKGRFWSLWGATDLVPVSDRVLVALPGLQNPFLDAAELTVTGPDTARISKATGFGSFGQGARLVRGKGGAVTEVVLAGGRLLDQASLAKEVRARRG